MHVATTRRRYKDKVYETHLLRRSFREDGKPRNETLANLSHLPPEVIDMIRRSLKGESFVSTDDTFEIRRSLPPRPCGSGVGSGQDVGVPQAAWSVLSRAGCGDGTDRRPGLPAGVETGRRRGGGRTPPSLWTSALSTLPPMTCTRLWTGLAGRQDAIEQRLAKRHLGFPSNRGGLLIDGWILSLTGLLVLSGRLRGH